MESDDGVRQRGIVHKTMMRCLMTAGCKAVKQSQSQRDVVLKQKLEGTRANF